MAMSNISHEIPKRIRNLRLKQNLTMAELAEELEITVGFMGLIERGQRFLSIEKLITLCLFFNTSLDYIILGEKYCEENSFSEQFNYNLNEEELLFLSKVKHKIAVHGCTGKDLDFLFNSLSLNINYVKENRRAVISSDEIAMIQKAVMLQE